MTARPIQLAIDTWAPAYGSALDAGDLQPTTSSVDVGREVPDGEWRPLAPGPSTTTVRDAVFVDGVRRIDARVWVTAEDGRPRGAIAVSIAAGAVRTNGRAEIIDARTDRLVIGPAGTPQIDAGGFVYKPVASSGEDDGALMVTLSNRLRQLERTVLDALPDAPLVVVDGPLDARRQDINTIGYVKTHHTQYLPPTVTSILGELGPGTRTPVFVVTDGSRDRYSWYVCLADAPGHPWAGVVRVETSAGQPLEDAVALADRTAASLPLFASQRHRDPRAPQNLVPIGGLERHLKRRLGDARLLERRLRRAVA